MERFRIILDFEEYHGDEKEDIQGCLQNLFNTPVGTVATDRDFGLDWECLDLPLPIAANRLVIEIVTKTRKYETRITIKDVECKFDEADGKISVKVVLEDG